MPKRHLTPTQAFDLRQALSRANVYLAKSRLSQLVQSKEKELAGR
jgi:hypothetical protein